MYAIRDDLRGCRAIASKVDVLAGEHFSEKPLSELPPATVEEVQAARRKAYADPETGCDRFFAEYVRLSAMGAPDSEIEQVKLAGIARHAEIQAENPYPESN